jgi:hypothetical protein
MEKLSTAKEFYLNKVFPTSFINRRDEVELCFETSPDAKQSVEIMIEFAKMHVEAALKAASEKSLIKVSNYKGSHTTEELSVVDYTDATVDKDSILNSYSLDNIK